MSISDRLTKGNDIRNNSVVLESPHGISGPPHSGLYLIRDVQTTVLAHSLCDAREKPLGGLGEAVRREQRIDDGRSWLVSVLDEVIDGLLNKSQEIVLVAHESIVDFARLLSGTRTSDVSLVGVRWRKGLDVGWEMANRLVRWVKILVVG